MPTITVDKKDVLKLVGKNISDEQLRERIPMLGTELEGMEGNEITLEITPDRPDMLTEEGFARALSSFLGIKTGLRNYKVNPSSYKFKIDPKVKKVRPAVAAAVIKGIKLDDATIKSIMDMQDKLTLTHGRNRKKVAIGIHDLDKISFPLVYTTKPRNYRFTPLDTKQLYTLDQILKLHPKGKEFGDILKGYDEFPMWIDAKQQVLSMPPIINSEETKLTRSTTNFFIDITGTDQHAVEQALNIIVTNLADRGGKIYKVNNLPNLNPKRISIDIQAVSKLLGITLTAKEVKRLVERMGMAMQGSAIIYPSYRADILHPVDIMEDIAVAYGYDKFIPEVPRVATIAEEDAFEKFKAKITEILIGLDITEVSTYHLTNKETQTTCMNSKSECIEIINPKSEEYNALRNQLIPSLLEVIKNNKHNEYPQKIGEIAVVFPTEKGKHHEETHMAIAMADTTSSFTQIKQVTEAVLRSLNIRYDIKEADNPSFIPGRAASISINGKHIAILGELHPQVLQNFQLEMPVVGLELNLSELYKEIN